MNVPWLPLLVLIIRAFSTSKGQDPPGQGLCTERLQETKPLSFIHSLRRAFAACARPGAQAEHKAGPASRHQTRKRIDRRWAVKCSWRGKRAAEGRGEAVLLQTGAQGGSPRGRETAGSLKAGEAHALTSLSESLLAWSVSVGGSSVAGGRRN